MTWYNMTFIENTSGPLTLFQGINTNSGSWFAGSILLFLFLILLVSFRRNGNQDAFLASSFIISVLAGMLWGIGLLQSTVLVIPVSILVLSLVMKVWGEG